MTTLNRLDLKSGRFTYLEVLYYNENNVPITDYRTFIIGSNSERWQEWLNRGEPFQVESTGLEGWVTAHFTARQEQIKNKNARFWYAYNRTGKKLRKRYLGSSAGLTLERLREVADRLAGELPAGQVDPELGEEASHPANVTSAGD